MYTLHCTGHSIHWTHTKADCCVLGIPVFLLHLAFFPYRYSLTLVQGRTLWCLPEHYVIWVVCFRMFNVFCLFVFCLMFKKFSLGWWVSFLKNLNEFWLGFCTKFLTNPCMLLLIQRNPKPCPGSLHHLLSPSSVEYWPGASEDIESRTQKWQIYFILSVISK